MYLQYRAFPLKCSASPLNNNLSCYFEDTQKYHLATVHKHLVQLVTYDGTLGIITRQVTCKGLGDCGPALMLQAGWVVFDSKALLVTVSQKGIQILDSSGVILLYWHSFLVNSLDDLEGTYTQGFTSVGSDLLVGSPDGNILVFRIPSEDGEISLVERIPCERASPTALIGKNQLLAAANENGSLFLWRKEAAYTRIHSLERSGYPCTCLRIWKNFLVASFMNGQLRLYNLTNGNTVEMVDAHARAITALDIAEDCGRVLTASEDGYVRVWQLTASASPVISHRYSENIADSLLCGACFVGRTGSSFCVASYDSNRILCYRL